MIDPKKTYVSPFVGLERKPLYVAQSSDDGVERRERKNANARPGSIAAAIGEPLNDDQFEDGAASVSRNREIGVCGSIIRPRTKASVDKTRQPPAGIAPNGEKSAIPRRSESNLAALREAVASIPAKKRQNGPKKGFGGRPVKTGAVSTRTMKRRGSRSTKTSDAN